MNKLLTKIVGLSLGLSMAIGVGVAASYSEKDAVRADAAVATDAYVFTDKSYNGTLNGAPYTLSDTLSDVTPGSDFTANQGIKHTAKVSSGATTVASYSKVSKITVYYCTNSKAGTGTIGFKVGSGTRQTFSVTKPRSGGTTQKSHDFTFSDLSGSITVDCSATANSVYLYGFTVTYDAGSVVPAASVTVNAAGGGTSLSLPNASSGAISNILSSVVYGSDGETLATNQKVTWSCEDATGVITFDNELKTYSVSGSVGASTKIYATSEDGNIKSGNYVSLTVAAPEMTYILIPGTNGYSDSAETTEIVWTDSTKYNDAYYLGIHFNMSEGKNSGQYIANGQTWRMYQGDSTVLTITVPLGQAITKLTFNYSTKNSGQLVDSSSAVVASETDWVPSSKSQKASFTVGNSGTATNGQVQLKSIAVTFAEATSPTVVIDPITSEIIKGSTGTFTAEVAHATSPSIAWTSSASGVIRIDNASTGAYTAVGEGTATITATLTCSEGSATDTIDLVVDTGLIEISEANNICEHLASGAQTDYKVTLSGHITDLDANAGKTNAFRIAKERIGTESANIMVFGIYSSNPLRSYAILNGTVKFTGYLQNFSGTYELVSPELVSYTDDAIEFATYAYNYLDESCQSGTQAVTSAQWTHLEGKWASDVDEYSQAKLISAKADPSAYGENIIKWVGRYGILVNAGFSDFMTNGSSARAFNGLISDETAVTMIVVIAAISITSIGALLVLKKRKEQF